MIYLALPPKSKSSHDENQMDISFHITAQIGNRTFRMLVTHYYSSEQVERFQIEGKGRFIKMEKRLLQKNNGGNGWKLIDGNIIQRYNSDITSAMIQVTGAIEKYLECRDIKQTTGYIDYLQFKKRW